MARVTDFSPSPDTILHSELNSIQDDYEAGISHSYLIHSGHFTMAVGQPTQDFLLTYDGARPLINGALQFFPQSQPGIFYYDPQMALGGIADRVPRLWVQHSYSSPGSPTGQSFVMYVSRITAAHGTTDTIGMTLTNQTATILTGTPSAGHASGWNELDTSSWPAGLYALRVAVTGTLAGASWSLNALVFTYA